jgi:Na+-transporting methylmalonyl-CoA/oxaloacetate decarboxylase gamma subunit
MRIDLSDLERLDGFAEALARLFWCLMGIALIGALLGSAGTGFILLVLGSLAFVGRAGLEDFVRSRRAPAVESKATAPEALAEAADPTEEPGITIYRAKPSRRRRSSKTAV